MKKKEDPLQQATISTSSTPTFSVFLACEKAQESKNCSLIAQRSQCGRLGKRLTFENEQLSDAILARTVCKSCGYGMSKNVDDLIKLAQGTPDDAKHWNEDEKEERERAFRRACSCAADIKLSSSDQKRTRRWFAAFGILSGCR